MQRFALALALLLVAATAARAVDTPTPTNTPTNTIAPTPTFTPVPPTATKTPNRSLQTPGSTLNQKTRSLLSNFSPASKAAQLDSLIGLASRQRTLPATNATPLGLTDVAVVTSVEAFVTSSGAAAAKALLLETIDFTVAGGDVTPIGDHSSQTWIVTYRP